jgi:hypothetical protein
MHFIYSYGIQSDFVPDGYTDYTTTGTQYQMPIEPTLDCDARPQTPHIYQYCNDGMDRSMVVINPNTMRLYELFGTDDYFANPKVARGGLVMNLSSYDLRGSWWGTYKLDFDGLYHPLPRSNPGLGGIMLAATYVTPGEIQAGEIKHAMYLMVDYAYSAGSEQARTLWPARAAWNQNCPTGYHNGYMCPFYGARLRLKNTTTVNTWIDTNAPASGTFDQRIARTILVGLQRYGAFISDNSEAHTDGRMWHLQGIQYVYENTSRTGSVETMISDGAAIYGTCGATCGWKSILRAVPLTTTYWDFVNETGQMINYNSMQVRSFGENVTPPDPPYTDPHEGYQPSNISGSAPLSVDFTDYSYDDPDNSTYWIWSYNNTDTDSVWMDFNYSKNASYEFTIGGDYLIRHTTGNNFGENTTPQIVWVNVSSMSTTASFTKSKSVVRIPSLINFNSTSTNATFYNWSLADGTYATTDNVTHRYTRPGSFNVSLTTTNAEGLGSSTAYSVVKVVRGGVSYEFTPGKENLMVNCDEFTYSTSREITAMERQEVEDRLGVICL